MARHAPDKNLADDERELTAQPKSMPEELSDNAHQEPGLSVDPEDLGRQFLGDAAEQHNYESSRGGETADMWVNSAAPSDEALPGPNFEGDRSIWENTVSLAMQSGGTEGAQDAVSPSLSSDIDEDEEDEADEHLADHDADVDLTETAIHDGSLFDREGEELGETEAPELNTDDTGTHSKRRGGHVPKGARR